MIEETNTEHAWVRMQQMKIGKKKASTGEKAKKYVLRENIINNFEH